MRKTLYIFAAALAFAGCQQDSIIENNDKQNDLADGKYAVKAAIETSNTRVNIDGYKVSWTAGDSFTVFGEIEGKGNCNFSKTNSDGTATFMSSMNPDEIAYAAYPTSMNPEMTEAYDSIKITLPNAYSTDMNSQNAPMYGEVDINTNSIKFQHLTALLKVKITNLPEGYNTLKFYSKDALAGTGRVPVGLSETFNIHANAKSTVTVAHVNNTDYYYLPLPAKKYGELHISALNDQNREIQLVTLFEQEFKSGTISSITRSYKENIITEPVDSLTLGNSSLGNYVEGWTKHKSSDQHSEITLEENLDPSFLWSKSIKIKHLDDDTWNHSICFNIDNTQGAIKPQLYKLSFKINTDVKFGYKAFNFVDGSKEQNDSFLFVINNEKHQIWQSVANTGDKFITSYVFIDFSRNGQGGWGYKVDQEPVWRETAGTDLMKHISIMFRNPNKGKDKTTIISDVQLSEVIGKVNL